MEIGKCDSDLFMLALFCLSSLIPDYLSIRVHDLCYNILIKYGKIPKIKPSDKTSPQGLVLGNCPQIQNKTQKN